MEITGTERFDLAVDRVEAALADLDRLAGAVPGLDSVESNDGTTLKCRIKPAFSFISGALRTTITRQARTGDAELVYLVESKGIGGGAKVTTSFRCTADAGGSTVDWRAEVVERTGLLKPVGASLIESSMRSVIDSTWEGLRAALGEPLS